MAETKPRPDYNRKATKAEREYRMRKLVKLIHNGWDNQRLRHYAYDEWGLGEKAARTMVNAAYDSIVSAMSQLDLQRIAAICLARFENAYALAAAQCNPMAMIQANAQIAQLWVKHAPEITYSDRSSHDQDPEEDF